MKEVRFWFAAASVACGEGEVVVQCAPEADCGCVADWDCVMSGCGPEADSTWGRDSTCTLNGWPVTRDTLSLQAAGCESTVPNFDSVNCAESPRAATPLCRLGACVAVIDPSE